MTNKVIFLIVEGFSDEAIFGRLKNKYLKYNIKFINIGGDLFGDVNSRVKIQNRIKTQVEKKILQLKLKKSDVLGVLQVTDLDGCMIGNDDIIVDSNQLEKTKYENNRIKLQNISQKAYIEKKNELKSFEIKRMNKYSHIGLYKYQIYYFARTMEHVIFNEANPDDDTKVENIETFIDTLDISIESYLSQFLPPIEKQKYEEKYDLSWDFVSSNNNSLHRFTNVSLLFEFVNTLSKIE